MSTRAPLLQIEGLKKAYGQTLVLDDVNLTIERGDFCAILGLSGAGKSTFLRCLNRLIDPSAGRILAPGKLFLGEQAPEQVDIARLSERELRLWRRKVGMIFQQFNLVKRLTVLENVLSGALGYQPTFWSSMRRFPAPERERAMRNLDRVGLLDQAYKRADALSGGQQQRVAIARALMQQPTVILADEPVASLDPKLAVQILEILKRVAREDGIAVLVSLHIIELARTYADRVVGLQGGRLVFDAAPELLDDAAVERVYARIDEPVGLAS